MSPCRTNLITVGYAPKCGLKSLRLEPLLLSLSALLCILVVGSVNMLGALFVTWYLCHVRIEVV